MLSDYLPVIILFFIACAVAFGIILISFLIGPRKSTKVKLSPYECGMTPIGSPRERFSIKFYLVAVMFIIFDIEAIFMYPWAVLYRKLGMFGFVEMMVFIGILLVGFVYVWKKGALEWE